MKQINDIYKGKLVYYKFRDPKPKTLYVKYTTFDGDEPIEMVDKWYKRQPNTCDMGEHKWECGGTTQL